MTFKDRILPNKHFLYYLAKSSPKHRKKILEIANKEELKAIIDILFNISRGSINISQTSLNKGKKHRKLLNRIVKRKGSINEKRRLLIQKGGAILPFLIIPSIIKTVIDVLKGE